MITITFQFTDVAAAAAVLAKLNGAELAVASTAVTPSIASEVPGKPSAAGTARSQPTAVAAQSPADPSPGVPAQSAEATQKPAAAVSANTPVTYLDLQKAVLTLHKLDPTAAVPIAKGLGADTFKLLPEAKWGEALRLVASAIEARGAA